MEKTFTAASLETAACLWEAVQEMLNGSAGHRGLRAKAQRVRENMGTSGLRKTVLGWTEAADADWEKVKETYDAPFDWEWIPEWVVLNVEWDGHAPELRSKRLVPGETA